jgi:hypothetical protein
MAQESQDQESRSQESIKFFIAAVDKFDLPKIAGELKVGDKFELFPEPFNKFDPNAVLIIRYENETVVKLGYVPKKYSALVIGMLNQKELDCVISRIDKDASTYKMCEVIVR